jgi:sugar phosphate isomerase/epimerase
MQKGAKVQLTILNAMAAKDFEQALDRHVEWNLKTLDLKDGIFGKSILDLTDDDAANAAKLISARRLSTYCMSTGLFFDDIEKGEAYFRKEHLGKVRRAVEIARILKPRFVRLLAARSAKRAEFGDGVEHIRKNAPWLITLYKEAISQIATAGFDATIENEVHGCLLTNAVEVAAFFGELGKGAKVSFTWDVQNMWQMGAFPSLAVYKKLKPLIGYFHLKGGMADGGKDLKLASSLEDASWPVLEITRQVVKDGRSPVICLNPSHGAPKPGYDYTDVVKRDIDFLRKNVEGIE